LLPECFPITVTGDNSDDPSAFLLFRLASDDTESLAAHFNRPRISALFDDFSVDDGESVSWRQLDAVTSLRV